MLRVEADQADLNIRILEEGGIRWINVENPAPAELDWLEQKFAFHPMALHAGPSHGQMSKLDDYGSYYFMDLHFPVYEGEERSPRATEVEMFIGANYLVMMHDGSLTPIVALFQQCEDNEGSRSETMTSNSGYLLFKVLDAMADYLESIVNTIEDNVDKVEELVFSKRPRDIVREISEIRRDIIADRRIMRHQIGVVEELELKEFPFLDDDPRVYLGEVADRVRGMWAEMEELDEVLDSHWNAHDTLVNHETNRVIRVLAIISAVLLPLSVISGFFGMNLWLPVPATPLGFGIVAGVMMAVVLALLGLFRLRRWI